MQIGKFLLVFLNLFSKAWWYFVQFFSHQVLLFAVLTIYHYNCLYNQGFLGNKTLSFLTVSQLHTK